MCKSMATQGFRACKQTLWSYFQAYATDDTDNNIPRHTVQHDQYRIIVSLFARREHFEVFFPQDDSLAVERGLALLTSEDIVGSLWADMIRVRKLLLGLTPPSTATTTANEVEDLLIESFEGADTDVVKFCCSSSSGGGPPKDHIGHQTHRVFSGNHSVGDTTVDWTVFSSVLFLFLHNTLQLTVDPEELRKSQEMVDQPHVLLPHCSRSAARRDPNTPSASSPLIADTGSGCIGSWVTPSRRTVEAAAATTSVPDVNPGRQSGGACDMGGGDSRSLQSRLARLDTICVGNGSRSRSSLLLPASLPWRRGEGNALGGPTAWPQRSQPPSVGSPVSGKGGRLPQFESNGTPLSPGPSDVDIHSELHLLLRTDAVPSPPPSCTFFSDTSIPMGKELDMRSRHAGGMTSPSQGAALPRVAQQQPGSVGAVPSPQGLLFLSSNSWGLSPPSVQGRTTVEILVEDDELDTDDGEGVGAPPRTTATRPGPCPQMTTNGRVQIINTASQSSPPPEWKVALPHSAEECRRQLLIGSRSPTPTKLPLEDEGQPTSSIDSVVTQAAKVLPWPRVVVPPPEGHDLSVSPEPTPPSLSLLEINVVAGQRRPQKERSRGITDPVVHITRRRNRQRLPSASVNQRGLDDGVAQRVTQPQQVSLPFPERPSGHDTFDDSEEASTVRRTTAVIVEVVGRENFQCQQSGGLNLPPVGPVPLPFEEEVVLDGPTPTPPAGRWQVAMAPSSTLCEESVQILSPSSVTDGLTWQRHRTPSPPSRRDSPDINHFVQSGANDSTADAHSPTATACRPSPPLLETPSSSRSRGRWPLMTTRTLNPESSGEYPVPPLPFVRSHHSSVYVPEGAVFPARPPESGRCGKDLPLTARRGCPGEAISVQWEEEGIATVSNMPTTLREATEICPPPPPSPRLSPQGESLVSPRCLRLQLYNGDGADNGPPPTSFKRSVLGGVPLPLKTVPPPKLSSRARLGI